MGGGGGEGDGTRCSIGEGGDGIRRDSDDGDRDTRGEGDFSLVFEEDEEEETGSSLSESDNVVSLILKPIGALKPIHTFHRSINHSKFSLVIIKTFTSIIIIGIWFFGKIRNDGNRLSIILCITFISWCFHWSRIDFFFCILLNEFLSDKIDIDR